MAYGGAQTELYSEVLSQFCLAFSIVNGKAMTSSDLNKNTLDDLKSLVFSHSRAKLTGKFIDELIKFGNHPISKGFLWVDGSGQAMLKVKTKFKINRTYKIYNDKLYGNIPTVGNPYSAFLKANTGAKPDKWNPADIWVINKEGMKALHKMNRKVRSRSKVSLGYANQFLATQFTENNIIPISLKKPQRSPHIDIVNSNEYVTKLLLDKSHNPTIEYTLGNKDVKINFTIETVKLAKGMKASTARRNPNNIHGTSMKGSEKHIRLKYHVDNKKVELEYTQTKGKSYAAAKMGNLGAANFQNIINKTSKQGVNKLNTIQKKYADIDIKSNPWFNGRQLGVTKARKEKEKLEPHYLRLADYVGDIWESISDTVPDFRKDVKGELSSSSGLWSKARAGELGMAVGAINNEQIKRRVIQNLFEAAASISYVTGLSKNEQELEELSDPSDRKVSFNASVYVKVY